MGHQAIVFLRLWASPSKDLELAQFDHLPHHQLGDELERVGLSMLEAVFGSRERWQEARAEENHESDVECRRRQMGQMTPVSGPSRSVTKVRTREECLEQVKADSRPLLLQLIYGSDLIQKRRTGGLQVLGAQCTEYTDPVVAAPVGVMICDSPGDAKLVASHLQRKYERLGVPQTQILGSKVWYGRDIVCRFGATPWSELNREERVEMLDQIDRGLAGSLHGLAQRGLELERVAARDDVPLGRVAEDASEKAQAQGLDAAENAKAGQVLPGEPDTSRWVEKKRVAYEVCLSLPQGTWVHEDWAREHRIASGTFRSWAMKRQKDVEYRHNAGEQYEIKREALLEMIKEWKARG